MKSPDWTTRKTDTRKLPGDQESLNALLRAPETRKLMELLNQQGGDGLQSAAQAAANGKPDALMGLLGQVMQSQEGAKAVEEFKRSQFTRNGKS